MPPAPVFAKSRAVTISVTPAGWKPCLGVQTILTFNPKSPYDQNWWWVDATYFLQEEDDLLEAVTANVLGPDSTLVEIATTITSDGLKAGFHMEGGSSGAEYTLVPLLTTTNGYQWSRNILMPILSDAYWLDGDTNRTGLNNINWRGPWQPNTAYAINDVFNYNGTSYIVITAFSSGSAFALTANFAVFAGGGTVTLEGLMEIYSELPTTLPATSGILWLDGGIPAIS
jgi:hypothetical protein